MISFFVLRPSLFVLHPVAYRAQYFDRKMRVGAFGDPVTATVTV